MRGVLVAFSAFGNLAVSILRCDECRVVIVDRVLDTGKG
jgi:hypothetical protein